MTHRALTFRSDFWAGGLAISGEWYVTQDDGTPLSFEAARETVRANPAKIFQGRVGPFPLPSIINPIIVISVWGGENDLWKCSGVLCASPSRLRGIAASWDASPIITSLRLLRRQSPPLRLC